jgi:cytochrome b subunit of formate dehydrogenase
MLKTDESPFMFVSILISIILLLVVGLALWCVAILKKNRMKKLQIAFRIVNSNILQLRDIRRQGIVIG